jgi:hypothetical protein
MNPKIENFTELEYLCKEIERIEAFPECPQEVEEFLGEMIVALQNEIEEILSSLDLTIN